MIMKDSIRIQAIEIVPMSSDGLNKFPPNFRKHVARTNTFRARHGITVMTADFDTEEKIAKAVWDNYGSGDFYIFGRSRGKAKHGNKPVRLCRVKIHDLGEEKFSFEVSQTWRLKQRYKWFYKGR